MNTRNLALRILLDIEEKGAYSTLALNKALRENKLNHLDSAFVSSSLAFHMMYSAYKLNKQSDNIQP